MASPETLETCRLLLSAVASEVEESKSVVEAYFKIREYELLFKTMEKVERA
jgi:hypothetical protein